MDALILALAAVLVAGIAALWWYGRLGEALALVGAGITMLLALAVTRSPRSRPPPTPPSSPEPDAHRSAGRRLDERRDERAPSDDADADARAAADRLNRRRR